MGGVGCPRHLLYERRSAHAKKLKESEDRSGRPSTTARHDACQQMCHMGTRSFSLSDTHIRGPKRNSRNKHRLAKTTQGYVPKRSRRERPSDEPKDDAWFDGRSKHTHVLVYTDLRSDRTSSVMRTTRRAAYEVWREHDGCSIFVCSDQRAHRQGWKFPVIVHIRFRDTSYAIESST